MKTILCLGAAALALSACGRAAHDPPPDGPINAQLVLDTCVPPAERPKPARDIPPARQVAIRDCVNAETARQYNAQLPLRVSQHTVMDQVSVAGPALVFRYTVDTRRDELPRDASQQIAGDVRAEACADAGFRTMLTMGGMQIYRWVDRYGGSIGEVRVDHC
jgi:hypothetical protein